ncbi:slit homolog 1 protein-like isoform X2 [Sitophilus oryzae]|uniref:Slit homolog 1 protein-like isoform X2 n=1 Tax=Sitophilus oryzae TaxID=7048 RepID=A0A6J2YDY0_SITOR|nr:slit homolog 1 protein-like isoform X2 [Sitophilus oryzae]
MYTFRRFFCILPSILVIVFIGYIQGQGSPLCKVNSEYKCNGTEFQCPDTKPEKPEGCKCYCLPGYWRDNCGNCVKECPCPPGKVWRESNSCFDRCNSTFCPQYLISGCFCPPNQCWNGTTCIRRIITT